MITIGGTMVWLPTDGNDTPISSFPGRIVTACSFARIQCLAAGEFNDYVEFEAAFGKRCDFGRNYESLMGSGAGAPTGFSRRPRPGHAGGGGGALRLRRGGSHRSRQMLREWEAHHRHGKLRHSGSSTIRLRVCVMSPL